MTRIRKKLLCSLLLGVLFQSDAVLPGADGYAKRQQGPVRTVIVVDSAVTNPLGLLQSPIEGGYEIIFLQPGDDPVEVIGNALYEKKIQSLHVVSHGLPGQLILAGQQIDDRFLEAHRQKLEAWSSYLTSKANIILYGCDVAQGAKGRKFVETLAAMMSADVAASVDKTGHASLGADWDLEFYTGKAGPAGFISESAQRQWRGTLAPGFSITETSGSTVVSETGSTDTFTVILTGAPASNVVIDVSSGDTGEATVSPPSLTFTTGNWNVAQTVTVTGVDDALNDRTQSTAITLSINDAGSDNNFDPLPNQVVTADTLDDEANASPENNLPASQNVNEDGSLLFNDANGNKISITDDTGENLEVTIGVANGALTLSQTTGLSFTAGDGAADAAMTFSGAVEDINSALDGLRYGPAADFNGNETLTISTSDEVLLSYELDANLQGYYKFDSGDTSGDSGPNGAPDGTLLDNATFVTDATRGDVLSLDGDNDGFDVATRFGQPTTFTLAAWVNLTGVDSNAADIINIGDNIIIRADASTTNNWGDGVSATIRHAGDTFTIWKSGQYIVGTGWRHVAFTYDNGTGMGRLYLDGTQVVSMTSATPIDWSQFGLTTRIGKHGNTNTTADFGGKIDDARIYNRALSTTEVSELYLAPTQTTDAGTLTIAVAPVNDSPTGAVSIDNTTPQVTDTLTASNTLADVDGISGPISYQWRRDGVNIGGATGSTYSVVAADTGAVISVTASYTDDDGTAESVNSADTAAVVTNGDFTITESGGGTAVSESGTTDTFTVVLVVQPASDVVIDVSSGDTGEATVSPSSLTFTNGNWNVAQTVTVTGVNDSIIDGTQNTTITLSVNDASSDDNYDPVADKTVTASTVDNDAAGFTIVESGGGTAVNESGTTDTFTVVLNAQPNTDVVIDIGSGDTGEATVSPASLTFTNGNWNVAQTVTVTGVDDTLIDGDQNTTITVSINDAGSDDNFDPVAGQTVTASTVDNDVAGFTIVETGGNTSVDESGATDTFTVVLTAQPVSDVVIDVGSGDTGEATVSPASLTFTNGNWNAAQTVTVTGVDDSLVDGAQNTTITLSINAATSDDSFDPLADQTVIVSTADDDSAGFAVTESGGNTSVNESGTTDTFTVVLTAQPASDVVIDVTSGDTGESTVSPASLTFTNGNWNVAQTVTVTGADDASIDGTQNSTITISVNDAASDDSFDSLADQTVTASTADDDSAGFAVTESGGNTSVNESGTADTFTIVLTAQPDSDVVIDLSSGDTGEATISPASLTFTNGNWNVAQTVTVTGVDDALIDGTQNTAITLSIDGAASDDNFDPLADQTVTASTIDDDAAGFAVVESGGNTSVNESGTTDTFTVVLSAQPDSDVVIDVSSADTGEATVSPASLTFTNGNWNVAQTVTVTGVNDVLIDGNQNTTVTLSIDAAASDNNFDSLADQTLTATTVDNDAAGFTVIESGGNTAVNESGTTDTFTVVLNAQPNSDVVIDIGSADTGEADVSPASLTFTTGNWSVAQTVTVTGVDDTLIDGTRNTAVTLSIDADASDDNFDALADQTVTAATIDDDAAGFTVVESGGNTLVNESGTTDTFTVVLTAQPDSDVVISISSGDTGEANVSPASLTFTTGNWSVAQTVTVTGVDDALVDGNRNTVVTLSVNDAASDNNFDALADQAVTVTTADDDAAGFGITESGGSTSVNESGGTDTFTVVLTAQPNSDVVIDIGSADTGEATVSPASLTFTGGNWNVAQTVTVTGVDDALIDGSQNTTITLSVNAAASDNNFDPLADQTVTATTVDNDAAGFAVIESGGNTSVNESGSTDTFTVVLAAQPGGDVVIDVSSGDTGEATVSPASLTFTNGNWNVAQTVTVTGIDDVSIDGAQNTAITLSVNDAASDDNYDALADQTVTATTVDDDAAGFTVVESGGGTSVNESGTTDAFTVVLNVQPASDVVIDVSSGDTGEATVSPASLTFTAGNWSVAQTVTVTGADDALADGSQNTAVTVSINDAGSDDNFDPLADQTVTVTTADNDAAGFTVVESGGGTSVNESGTTDTFTVVLTAQPNSDVIIDVSSGNTGEATVSPASLTFTAGNWSAAQTVTVTGAGDASMDGDQITVVTVSVNAAASDDDYDPLPDQTVTVTTVDDDAAGFTVTESGGNTAVNESGTTDTFTVVLNAQPAGNVVIDIGSGDAGEATVTPASLTFTGGNWNVAQAVTVTGIDDVLIDGNQNVAITLAVNDAASDNNFDPLPDRTVTVTVIDDDASPDADGDGIPNIVEGLADADFDGTPNFLDTDSDNDGIPDYLEADNVPPLTGVDADSDGIDDVIDVSFTGGVDMNADGVDDALEPDDSDGDGASDYLDVDSDNDGIPDGIEADNMPALAGSDADGDGIDDALDTGLTGGPDADGNGVDDRYEPRDSDGDGLADYLDNDSDNDGIHDSIEGGVLFADSDGDGIDDRYDIDVTGGADIDGDGSDDNAAPDSDNDGRPDYRDLDSDNDGLPDVIEAGLSDVDGDGFADNAVTTLSPSDTDFDGTADYRDPDSDNDGAFDIVTAGYTQYDVNNDGRIDAGFFADPDNDGVPNVIDPAPAVFGLLNNGDSDGDGVPDNTDMDDDNDGIPDAIESPGGADIDSDGDGIVDRLDRDSDDDGIPDSLEAFYSFELDSDVNGVIDDPTDTDFDGLADVVSASMMPEDTDSDGNPDYLDPDSDNDGLYDLLELAPASYSALDADGSGQIDNPVDSDGDGLADVFDPDSGSYLSLEIPDSDSDGIADFRDTDSDNDGFGDNLENGDFNGNGIMDFVESGRGISTSIPNGGGGGVGWLWIAMLLLFNRQKKIRKRV